jgi:type IV pilus assembly protein PilC
MINSGGYKGIKTFTVTSQAFYDEYNKCYKNILMVNKSEAARYRLDQLKLNIPMTGNILHKIIMARFARYFALMYQTGIPILEAMHICEQIVGNRVIAAALNRAHVQVSAGDAMSESFQNVGLFPPLVVRMIKIGESTGGLDKSLLNISYF